MTLIFVHKVTYITWLQFLVIFFSASLTSGLRRHMLSPFYKKIIAVRSQFERNVPMKLKVPGDLLSK